MGPTNNIGYLIQRLSFCLARQSDQVLQEQLGIGLSQFKILMVLGWHSNVQQRHIADKLGQTEASISRQIKLLKDKGLLTTEISPQNRREHITKPTAKGQRLSDKALEVLNDYHSPMFAKLSEKQQKELLENLTTLYDYACMTEKPSNLLHKPHK
ncbi:MAG TPA: MarR family winged helix-turn-helix transcriptional regulator [Candidatus Saccharimonadales bacterium]|nr:MarR family winged helix-turn-helix transcriptional regulator [Candidatus Saccharimonadales bacterium]